MSHIFISYSRQDIDFAQKIVDALGENELETWIDWKSIPKGEDWWEHIQNGIEEADAFLFLITPAAARSEVCRAEIEHAQKNGKRILPVLIQDTAPKDLHNEIAKRNWVYCREGQDDFQAAIAVVLETIRTDYEWLKVHTRLQVKAREWERTQDPSRLLRGNELRQAEEQLAGIETQKEPGPTVLQRQYLLSSRRNEERARRRTIASLVVVLAIMITISIFAVGQRNTARAESQAKETALVLEAKARGTAQAEQKRAEEQARIARARELAAQAQLLSSQQAGMLEPSMLLAIESLRLSHSPVAAQVLHRGIQLLPSATTVSPEEFIISTVLSPDEAYMLVRTPTHAILFETRNGKESMRIALNARGQPAEQTSMTPMDENFGGAFDPSGQWLATVNADGALQVWKIPSGELQATIPFDDPVVEVGFSPEGESLAVLTEKNLRVVAFPQGKVLFRSDLEMEATDLAFSSDGRRVACACDASAQVWEIPTGRSLAILPHEGKVIGLAFLQDRGEGPMLSSITAETLLIWDLDNQTTVTEIPSIDALIALSEDGRRFVSAGDHFFRVRNAESGDEVLGVETVGDVRGARFSPNGNRLVVATGEPLGGRGEASLWNLETSAEMARVSHDIWTGQVNIGNDRFFTTASRAGVKIWDVAQGGALGRQLSDKTFIDGAFSRSGVWLATGGTEGVWVWHTVGQVQLAYIPLQNVSGLAFSPDDRHLAVLAGRQVDLFSVPSGKQARSFYHGDEVKAFAFDAQGSRLATASDGGIRTWEIASGELVEEVRTASRGIQLLAFSSDNALLLAADAENVFAWDLLGAEQILNVRYPGGFRAVGFLPNSHKVYGNLFSDGTNPGQAFLYDLDQGRELVRSEQRNAPLAFSEDGKWLASASDTTVKVWDTATGREQYAFEADFTVLAMAFSRDGSVLAVGGGRLYEGAGQVRLLEMGSGQKIGQLVQDRVVYALAFNSDNHLLATGSWDDTARVWEIPSGQEIFRLLSPRGVVTAIRFSPDDRWLAYRTDDDRVHITPWNPEDLIRSACHLIDYTFSATEWPTYFPEEPFRFICPP